MKLLKFLSPALMLMSFVWMTISIVITTFKIDHFNWYSFVSFLSTMFIYISLCKLIQLNEIK